MADFAPNPRSAPTVNTVTLRGPENQNSSRVVVDMEDKILMYQPEATPLLTLTSKLRDRREAVNYNFQWLEKDEYPRALDVTAATTDVATSITIQTGQETRVAAGHVLMNTRTREQIIVGATSSGTISSLTRGIGGQSAAVEIGDRLVFTRAVAEDGAGIGAARSIQEFNKFNYTETIRTPFGFTGRDLNTELYGGRDEMTETKWQSIEHKKSMEYALLFGRRHLVTSGTHYKSFTGGLEYFIETNVWNVEGTTLNSRTFNEFLEEGMRWGQGGSQNGTGKKFLLVSSRWLTEINDWANQRLEYRILDKSIGFSAMEYNSPHGTVFLLKAPLLDAYHPDFAFLIDPNHLRFVYHRGRNTKLYYDRQANDVDGRQNEYLSDIGLQVGFEHAHALLRGLPV